MTDDFLRAYYLRPEMRPVEDSCEAEIALHEALMESPRRAVAESELLSVEDKDTQENYRLVLRFRDRLLAAGTIEGCYLQLFKGPIDVPPLFIAQLAHVILRNVLDDCEDPLELRCAELFFREQKAALREGHVMLADLETVEMQASGHRYGSLGRLIVEAGGDLPGAELDVLDRANAPLYWERESRYDTAISFTYGRPVVDAFSRAVESWVFHFLHTRVRVKPIRAIAEQPWAWHVGLDAESTAILNELWSGAEVDAGRMQRIVGLFSLEFEEAAAVRPDVAGRSVYLALASDEEGVVRMKPQNLLINLPLHAA